MQHVPRNAWFLRFQYRRLFEVKSIENVIRPHSSYSQINRGHLTSCALRYDPAHMRREWSSDSKRVDSSVNDNSNSDENTINNDRPSEETLTSSEYNLDELLHNIRLKVSPKDDVNNNSTRQLKRDVNSLMSIDELVEYLMTENASDICVIRIPPDKRYVDYLVICSGASTRHIRTMSRSLAKEMRHVKITGEHEVKTDHRRVIVEGEDSEDWMAVDIGNIVVHFMLSETREKYQIEKLWTLGEEFDDMTIDMKKYMDLND